MVKHGFIECRGGRTLASEELEQNLLAERLFLDGQDNLAFLHVLDEGCTPLISAGALNSGVTGGRTRNGDVVPARKWKDEVA